MFAEFSTSHLSHWYSWRMFSGIDMDLLSNLDVDGVFELVGTKLKLPKLAELFKEQDIDGSVLPLLTTTNIQQFLPSVTLGQCLKFFEGLKKYKEQCVPSASVTPGDNNWDSPDKSVDDSLMTSSLRSPSPPSSPLCLRLPESAPSSPASSSHSEFPPPVNCRQPLTPLPSSGNVCDLSSMGTLMTSSTTQPSPTSRNCPAPKEFPVDKLEIATAGRTMISTGTVTAAGKVDITNAVLPLLLKYSTSDGYVSFSLKRLAASSLVHKYPSLTMGLSVKHAVDAWHKSLSQKIINWRKRGKVSDPKMALMKEKHRKRRVSEPENSLFPKRRRMISNQTESMILTQEEIDEQTLLKQEMAFEMSKPASSRNLKVLEIQSRTTYQLRRKYVLEETPHAHDLLKEWPSLRNEMIILKEMNLIEASANSFPVFQSRLLSLTPALIAEARVKIHTYPRTHCLVELLHQIPQTLNTDPDYDSDLNIIGAVCGLAYLLPTTSKKIVYPHKYLIDVCAVNTPLEEIKKAVPDRDQPFIMIFGSVTEPRKIILYVDKEPVCQCTSVARALYGLVTAYYMLNVAYSLHVSGTLEFLQDMCVGLPMSKPQTKVRELKSKLTECL